MRRSTAVRDLLVELAKLVLAQTGALDAATDQEQLHEPSFVVDGAPSTVRPDAIDAQSTMNSNEERGSATDRTSQEPATITVPLTLGGSTVTVEVKGSASDIANVKRSAIGAGSDELQQEAPNPKSIDLGLIERRARLKAESCRLFITLRRRRGDPTHEPALKARMDEMIATARSMPDCFLWVFWRHEEQPEDNQLLKIATCYDALAEATALCARAVAPDGFLSESDIHKAFQLLAEASSALRVALGATWLKHGDIDQEDTHLWLCRETFKRAMILERHMKLDDPASPERADCVVAEAKQLLDEESDRAKKAREIDQLLSKAKYHAQRIRKHLKPDHHDFETINEVMDDLRTSGVGPTDARVTEFRESIQDIEFPPDLPRHDHLTFEPRVANETTIGEDDKWNQRVAEVRPLLEGGRIIIVGGEPRQDAIERMENAFGATIEWVELSEHGSGERMKHPINRPDTRVVLLLIKLIGHHHADDARNYARSAGVPWVNIEAGYNPNMVAEQVMEQAEKRLRARTCV